jgi:hypothetical protein
VGAVGKRWNPGTGITPRRGPDPSRWGVSAAAPAPGSEPPRPAPPALPEHGPRLLLAPAPAEPPDPRGADPSPELLRLAETAESLLGDPLLGAVAELLRDAARAVAAADAHVAGARAEAAQVAGRAEDDVARLWHTVSADVATRRAATDAFVARALERAKAEADAIVADAPERAALMVARAEELVAAWLDEANAEVARILESLPAGPVLTPVPDPPDPPPPARPRGLRRHFRRRAAAG